MRKFFSILFIVFLILPVLLQLSPFHTGSEGTPKTHKAPGWLPYAMTKTDYYKAWSNYFDERISQSAVLSIAKRWFDYRVFSMTDSENVYVGREGWLFDQYALERYVHGDCKDQPRYQRQLKSHIQEVYQNLQILSGLEKISGHPVVVSIAPDKSTIYPEYLGTLPPVPECAKNTYDFWLENYTQSPLDTFIQLDQYLFGAKSRGVVLYQKTGTAWTPEGVDIVSRVLMKSLFCAELSASADNDLAGRLLNRRTFSGETIEPNLLLSGKHLSSILVYGGPQASMLLNGLAAGFDRVDFIDSARIPSQNYHEDITRYDAILIMIEESRIADLHIDLDRWCNTLSVENMAVARNSVPLKSFKIKKNISIDENKTSLTIKSMGSDSFFTLPALPGSASDRLHILKLKLHAPRADTLTWMDDSASGVRHQHLKPGQNKLYLPLAYGASVRVNINPGRQTGIFNLDSAEFLEFDLTGARSDVSAKNKVKGKIIPPSPPETASESHNLKPRSSHPSAIVLNDFEQGSIFQRKSTAADIVISGTFSGDAAAVEAQVEDFTTHKPVVPWTVIDNAPTEGIFIGILPEVPQGGWYRVSVRFSDQPEISDTGRSRWGIGMLVACIGQSNMKEWFNSGKDMLPHSLASLHRDGHWQTEPIQGNGATVFVNRLIDETAIPVGLLDYAVNGSGLCKEADWGTGYWSDQSKNSIYRQLVDAVADTGGALEYVLWMQGEADAAQGTISERHYLQTLTSFIEEQIRKDIVNGSTQPHLPFLVIGMVKRPIGHDAPHQAVRNALWQVTRDIPQCYMAATTLDLKNLGRQHLAPEAYTTLGLRVSQTILFLLGEETYYRGPSVLDVYRTDPHTIEVRLMHRGGNDFGPESNITGWQVMHESEKISIEKVSRVDARTLRINLTEAAPGPLKVSYLCGAMPDTRHPVRDNSPIKLPLEPFEQVIP